MSTMTSDQGPAKKFAYRVELRLYEEHWQGRTNASTKLSSAILPTVGIDSPRYCRLVMHYTSDRSIGTHTSITSNAIKDEEWLFEHVSIPVALA